MGLITDVENVAGDNRRSVDARSHFTHPVIGNHFAVVVSHRFGRIGRMLEDADASVFITNIDLPIDDERRAPDLAPPLELEESF